jgi:hypothetical protein
MSSKPDKNLLENLLDVVGAYTDEKTYETLINYDSETFTKKKLIKNMLNDISLEELSKILKAYNYSKKWIDENQAENTEPVRFMSYFNTAFELHGDISMKKLEKIKYNITVNGTDSKSNLQSGALSVLESAYNLLSSNINTNEIFNNLDPNFLENFKKFINIGDIEDDEEIQDEFNFYFFSQIEKLIIIDPNFHPLANLDEYKDKLLQMMSEDFKE